jgi:methionyl-tRNA synthetase
VINLAYLLACIIAFYMPDTVIAIDRQLRVDSLVIPDYWTVDTIKPGYEIGKVEYYEYLFGPIKPQKAAEWRTVFWGGHSNEKEKTSPNEVCKRQGR